MATRTLGTAATTTLTAVSFSESPNVLLPADLATIQHAIKNDLQPLDLSVNTWIMHNGLLMIPRRGQLRVFPGDFFAVDSTGWPILLSSAAAASASWVHT